MPSYHAACAPGLEEVLISELSALGAEELTRSPGGAGFVAAETTAWRICLWSRVALRVFEHLISGQTHQHDDVYTLARRIPWENHLTGTHTIAVFASAPEGVHTKFMAQRLKDAVCDRMRDETGRRPDVDIKNPDVPIKVVVRPGGHTTIGRDLAGDSLHRRGWRPVQVRSPMNEALAAGLLLLSGWDRQTPLVDPMCGSGTLLIEAAHLAGDRAPGLDRSFAFERWPDFRKGPMQQLRDEARERARAGRAAVPPLQGADRHPSAVGIASKSAGLAGVADQVSFAEADIASFKPQPLPGMLVCNPPYGKRIGEGDDLIESWRQLGTFMHEVMPAGSEAWILSGNKELTRHLRMRASLRHAVKNTSIDCRWIRYEIG